VAHLLADECRRDVALRVPGGHQHQRYGDQLAVSAPGQRRDGVGDRRVGELDEPARNVEVRRAALHQVDEVVELRDAIGVARAVADQEQRERHRSSSSA
jgi:hypothetical protein